MALKNSIAAETFSSLRILNFKLYFLGQALSVIGTFMQALALGWLVLTLTHSGTALGLVMLFQFLPILFFAPYGGVIADRFAKRRVLYVTQSAYAILALALGVVVLLNAVQLWMVYALALCFGLVTAVDNPVKQTFIIELVGKDDLKNALTLNSTAFNIARIVGPMVGGVLIAVVGIGFCFIINAASYLAVLAALAMMDGHAISTAPIVRDSGRLSDGLKGGWRYVRGNKGIFTILVIGAIIGTLTYEFQTSLPLMASFAFHGDAGTYALLLAAFGLGAVIGGLILASKKTATVRLFVISTAFLGIAVTLAAFLPTLAMVMLALVCAGVFNMLLSTVGSTFIQVESDPAMRGRVMSFWTIAFQGSTAIGAPLIGWIGDHAGARWSLGVGGIAAIVAAGIGILMVRGRRIRT